MSVPIPRRRKPAVPLSGKTVKASILVGVELHARWAAAAALRGMDRSAFAVEAIAEACKGIIVVNKGRKSDRVNDADRLEPESNVNPEGKDVALEGPGLTIVANARPAASNGRARAAG